LRSPEPHLRYVSTQHAAVVLSVVKSTATGVAPGGTIHFHQVQAGSWGIDGRLYDGAEPAYRVGDEFIGFFARERDGQLAELESGEFMFRVIRDSVSWTRAPSHGVKNGMSVEAVLGLLRKSLSARTPISRAARPNIALHPTAPVPPLRAAGERAR